MDALKDNKIQLTLFVLPYQNYTQLTEPVLTRFFILAALSSSEQQFFIAKKYIALSMVVLF